MAVLNFYAEGKKIPEGAEYIGRGNAKLGLPHSKFANPFRSMKRKQESRWLKSIGDGSGER